MIKFEYPLHIQAFSDGGTPLWAVTSEDAAGSVTSDTYGTVINQTKTYDPKTEQLTSLARCSKRRVQCPLALHHGTGQSSARKPLPYQRRRVCATWMSNYRRHRLPGATYFFTLNLRDRKSSLLIDQVDVLRHIVARVRALMPFHIDAWVVLPDHMHCLWTLPEDDGNFSKRWQAIKMGFSRRIPPGEPLSASRQSRGERGIWQRRFWEHTVRDERDYAAHMDYVHFNPVKHGYVLRPADWAFSSFHQCVRHGLYPSAWAGQDEKFGEWGERG